MQIHNKMNQNSKVWVVDDDDSFRHYLTDMLDKHTSFEVAGSSSTLKHAYSNVASAEVDLVTVDLSLPDGTGIEFIKWLELHFPNLSKIIVSFWGQENQVFEAFKHGVDGYIQKEQLLTMDTDDAIAALEMGSTQISPKLAQQFLAHFNTDKSTVQAGQKRTHNNQTNSKIAMPKQNSNTHTMTNKKHLTHEETTVLEQLVQGLNYHEIADKLGSSAQAVYDYVFQIGRKLNINLKQH